ncbi:MAG: radical SAM protein [Pseudomonadota bacterium]
MPKIEQMKKDFGERTIVIWGARMTGLGALRQCRSAGILPVAFIDSDPAFKGKTVANLPVFSPAEFWAKLTQFIKPAVLIAVSLKEDEIRSQILAQGSSGISIFSFHDASSPYYTVDVLGSCNLSCRSCPHSIEAHGVPKGSMELSTFKQVFNKIVLESPGISHLSLYSWGEPLLHPYIADIVEYVHSMDVAVALSSNLSIRFESRIEALIQQAPDYLKVSVSGYYQDIYGSTHQGGDVNLVKSNLYRLRHLIDKYNSGTLVDINYHLYRNNNGVNLEMFRRLADELGFIMSETYALVMPLERVINHLDGKPDLQTQLLKDNLLVTIDEGIEASSVQRLRDGYCPFRENQVNINADLTVPVCCTVFHRNGTIVANNFLNTDADTIRANKTRVELCNRCTKLALPEYNLGLNHAGWDVFAREKQSTDDGNQTQQGYMIATSTHGVV